MTVQFFRSNITNIFMDKLSSSVVRFVTEFAPLHEIDACDHTKTFVDKTASNSSNATKEVYYADVFRMFIHLWEL